MIRNIRDEIIKLKQERNAVILAHYYQEPEIQELADYTGDSYYLSKVGRECTEETIVFCGVKFMAESAKILSPNKRVLLPNMDALCCMVYMADAKQVEKLKREYPNAKVVCYVNSSTEVKAVSDVCCTSSSAVNIIKNIDSDEIIFVPDRNLGSYVQEKVPEKKIILWNGCCNVHDVIDAEEIQDAKERYGQDIKVLVHPECKKEVRDLADFIGSTGEIIKFASSDKSLKYLIVTEVGILHELKKNNPNKEFYTLDMVCGSMKITTMENIYNCLKDLNNEIQLDEGMRKSAHKALENMHILGG